MKGLTYQVKQKATNGVLRLTELGPNSLEIAKRLIAQGELIKSKCGTGFVIGGVAEMKWISVKERLPELEDNSVLAYWHKNGGMDMVHIEDYFGDITDGIDDEGNQKFTKWYISSGVTHWMPLPAAPEVEE